MNIEQTVIDHDEDFYEWAQRQARLLHEGRFHEADIDHIVEEIESLGRSDLSAAGSLAVRIMEHLLYLKLSPSELPRAHWKGELIVRRGQLSDRLRDSPSLQRKLADAFDEQWRRARRLALVKLGERDGIRNMPTDNPFTLEQVLDEEFFPDLQR